MAVRFSPNSLEKKMSTKQQDKQPEKQDKRERPELNGVIGKHVMHTLGQPGSLLKVQVRQLWEDHYRVNVLVGGDAACAKVAHSYFLTVDSGGNIVSSNPNLRKEY
jgi:hypothetical protein